MARVINKNKFLVSFQELTELKCTFNFVTIKYGRSICVGVDVARELARLGRLSN